MAAPPPPPPSLARKLIDIAWASLSSFLYRMHAIFKFLLNTCRRHPFYVELCYYLTLSLLGTFTIMHMKPRASSYHPKYIDMFYMSSSSVTCSGLNTVDTEIFSGSQFLILTFLMLTSGEVFVSFLILLFRGSNYLRTSSSIPVVRSIPEPNCRPHRFLVYVIGGYLLLFHVAGFMLVLVYLYAVDGASRVLESKGVSIPSFAMTAVVTSFASCGLLPTNENIAVFKSNSGLLLMLIVIILGGNTLYPLCLRSVVWVLRRVTGREEFDVFLKGSSELGYPHIIPAMDTVFQSLITTAALLLVQVLLFAGMSWTSEILSGLNSYQKVVGVLFQSVNTRHSGEGVFDLSIAPPAVIVLFIVMMYLPAYTTVVPIEEMRRPIIILKRANISQSCYVVIFVIISCILERERMSKDPLNFNVLSIAFEIISAYGNVGLSMGYRCDRMITPDANCKAGEYSFSGRWSSGGKLLTIFVMFFGRLKRYHMSGGKANW